MEGRSVLAKNFQERLLPVVDRICLILSVYETHEIKSTWSRSNCEEQEVRYGDQMESGERGFVLFLIPACNLGATLPEIGPCL